MKNIKIELNENQKELVIREGQALPLEEKNGIYATGLITSPAIFLEKRTLQKTIENEKCHVIIDREKMTISLVVNEREAPTDKITGVIQFSKAFKEFGINEKTWTLKNLANIIKLNKHLLNDKEEAMRLVSELLNFKGKINKEIEKLDDRRGNKTDLIQQVVNSNIPDGFAMKIEIFKGVGKQIFKVDIELDSRDTEIEVKLISSELNEVIENYVNSIIDIEKEKFSDITIIEI
jgi:hypothetical protein